MSVGTTTRRAPISLAPSTLLSLLRAAHPGPAATVSTVTALLAVASKLRPRTAVTVTAAVLTGQLTIGWVNDLADAERDATVGRSDKPIASGRLDPRLVRLALWPVAGGCVGLSSALGWRAAAAHLGLGVGSAQAYNLWLKSTSASWLPFAVAFGSLPAVVSLSAPAHGRPPGYVVLAGSCLGTGAHLLNALPDLADDESTGVVGAPHRLGAARARILAAALLGTASLAAVLGPGRRMDAAAASALAGTAGLVGVTLLGRGGTPFKAAMLLALLDVALLVRASR